jgi:hypothetical protein
VLSEEEAPEVCDFLGAIERSTRRGAVAFALSRFEMGCSRRRVADALPDYLLGLRALLDAVSDAGRASLSLRLAALCAEEGERRAVQRRVELAQSLERRFIGAAYSDAIEPELPHELVAELEGYLRALLRDVLCGYLDPDLASVADDILLEARGEPERAAAEPLRPPVEPEPAGPVRAERMAGPRPGAEPGDGEDEWEAGAVPEGVTGSIDWDAEADPGSYSAPI